MKPMTTLWALVFVTLVVVPSLGGQETVSDDSGRVWAKFGIYTLGLRGGFDLEGNGQALAGGSLDVGYLYSERLRFRLVGELGFAPSPNSYVGSFELVYRFTSDSNAAIPYIGTGIALAGNELCGDVPGCPAVWWQFVLGFELRLNDRINWLIEYHPQNALRRHRILVGVVMRGGGF